jgi:hypothetical protein
MGLMNWAVLENGYDPVGTNYWLHESGNWVLFFMSDLINGGLSGTENYWFIRDVNFRHDPWGTIDSGIGLYEQADGIGTAPTGSNPAIPTSWSAVTGISIPDTSTNVFVAGVAQSIDWVNMFGMELTGRVENLEHLGLDMGTFTTYASVPTNSSGFLPLIATVNNFLYINSDEVANEMNPPPTRRSITAIAGNGNITLSAPLILRTDITGKENMSIVITESQLAGLISAPATAQDNTFYAVM